VQPAIDVFQQICAPFEMLVSFQNRALTTEQLANRLDNTIFSLRFYRKWVERGDGLDVAADNRLTDIDSADRQLLCSIEVPVDRCIRLFGDARRAAASKPSLRTHIDRYRTAHNHLTLEQFAEEAGISLSTLQRMRRGKFSYSSHAANLKKVAAFMGCDLRDLMRNQE